MSDGAYNDYAMMAEGQPMPSGGICHKRGLNSKLPPVWVPYFLVESLEQTLGAATEAEAQIVDKREQMAVLKDPAGVVFAVWEHQEPAPGADSEA